MSPEIKSDWSPSPALPARRPRIVAVGRYRLGRVFQSLLPTMAHQARWELMQLSFAEAVAALEQAHADEPVDAVVAAGANGAYLRAHLDLPVALVDVNSFDLLRALSQARPSPFLVGGAVLRNSPPVLSVLLFPAASLTTAVTS